jgi:hypothetical protein
LKGGVFTLHRSDIMALLGNLLGLGLSRSRGYGSGDIFRRSVPRSRGFPSFGRARAPTRGMFGGTLGRMALGGAAAMLTRSLLNRRYRSY